MHVAQAVLGVMMLLLSFDDQQRDFAGERGRIYSTLTQDKYEHPLSYVQCKLEAMHIC